MKGMHPRNIPLVAVVVTLLGGNISSLSADPAVQAAQNPVTKNAITPSQQADITSAAIKVLRHIAQARGLLNDKQTDSAGAIDELKQADQQLDIISESLPTTKLKDSIWIATKHLEYENTDEVLPDMAPIFASLEEVVDYLPTERIRQHLNSARQALEKGEKSAAIEQLKAADESLVYVEIDLPLKSSRRLVHDAWQALQRDDIKQADTALNDAEDNVVFISLAFQSPLVTAKSAIARSRNDDRLGNRQAAVSDLSDAVNHLREAAESSDRVTRKAANALIAQLRKLERALASGDMGFEQKITAAWHRIEALSERAAERVSTNWDRHGSGSEVKRDLIEAKLQLAYARIDHVLLHDKAAAKVDISETDSYLSTARTKADIAVERQLQAMSMELAGLETSLGNAAKADNSAPYFALESEMAHLIATL